MSKQKESNIDYLHRGVFSVQAEETKIISHFCDDRTEEIIKLLRAQYAIFCVMRLMTPDCKLLYVYIKDMSTGKKTYLTEEFLDKN